MQRHRNVEIKRIVVAHAGHEEHHHQDGVVLQADPGPYRAAFGCEQETLDGDQQELQEGDQIPRSWIDSEAKKGKWLVLSSLSCLLCGIGIEHASSYWTVGRVAHCSSIR